MITSMSSPMLKSARAFVTRVRPAYLCSLGTAIPQGRLDNAALAARFQGLTVEGIESRTGIHCRRIATDHETTSDLALAAGLQALRRSEISPDQLDLVLIGTATPDHLMPATACRLQHALAARHAVAMDVSAACSGFLYCLWIAQQMIQTGQADHVLVAGAEIMSRIVDPNDANSAILFGDGAGAAVLSAAEGPYRLGRFWGRTLGGEYDALIRGGGAAPAPAGSQPGASGEYFIKMDGRRVFRAAVEGFSQAIQQTAARNGLSLADLDWIVPHQANARIIQEVARRLEFPSDRFWLNLSRYGNTGAASIPLAMDELHSSGAVTPGGCVLLACVGAGMTIGGLPLFAERLHVPALLHERSDGERTCRAVERVTGSDRPER
ncbi:MAG: 3-oxoacyl-ACP synthase III family protein [Planctomycetaceae bacterium]